MSKAEELMSKVMDALHKQAEMKLRSNCLEQMDEGATEAHLLQVLQIMAKDGWAKSERVVSDDPPSGYPGRYGRIGMQSNERSFALQLEIRWYKTIWFESSDKQNSVPHHIEFSWAHFLNEFKRIYKKLKREGLLNDDKSILRKT